MRPKLKTHTDIQTKRTHPFPIPHHTFVLTSQLHLLLSAILFFSPNTHSIVNLNKPISYHIISSSRTVHVTLRSRSSLPSIPTNSIYSLIIPLRHAVSPSLPPIPFTPPSPPTPTTTPLINQIPLFFFFFSLYYLTQTNLDMLDSVLLALFLPCIGMSAVFVVYMCLLWYATTHQPNDRLPAKPVSDKGLSPSDLQKLPSITGKDLVMGAECAVCLDEISNDQPARVIPGCNHAFHLECADTWLSKHPLCPVCRATLDPNLFTPSENPC